MNKIVCAICAIIIAADKCSRFYHSQGRMGWGWPYGGSSSHWTLSQTLATGLELNAAKFEEMESTVPKLSELICMSRVPWRCESHLVLQALHDQVLMLWKWFVFPCTNGQVRLMNTWFLVHSVRTLDSWSKTWLRFLKAEYRQGANSCARINVNLIW